jgi:hypothetical protein
MVGARARDCRATGDYARRAVRAAADGAGRTLPARGGAPAGDRRRSRPAAERRATTERFTTLQARYDELRKTVVMTRPEDAQMIDAFGDVARLALDAGRLRSADRARAAQPTSC